MVEDVDQHNTVFNHVVSFIYPAIQFVVSGRDFVCIFFSLQTFEEETLRVFSLWEFSNFVAPGTSQEDCQSFQHRRLQQKNGGVERAGVS